MITPIHRNCVKQIQRDRGGGRSKGSPLSSVPSRSLPRDQPLSPGLIGPWPSLPSNHALLFGFHPRVEGLNDMRGSSSVPQCFARRHDRVPSIHECCDKRIADRKRRRRITEDIVSSPVPPGPSSVTSA